MTDQSTPKPPAAANTAVQVWEGEPPAAPHARPGAPAGADLAGADLAGDAVADDAVPDDAVAGEGGAMHRRTLFGWLAAGVGSLGLAPALSGCSRPAPEAIVPYVDMPEAVTPGQPAHYSTVLQRDGFGYGVVVQSHQGRPTKIEGNPAHPATRGATDARLQAAVLEVYDPHRSQRIYRRQGGGDQQPATVAALEQALAQQRERWQARRGEGLRLLTPPLSSPSLGAQIDRLLADWPGARRHQWCALPRDNMRRGARLAFGEALNPCYHLERAEVIVQLDGDFLSDGPDAIALARDFAAGRRPPAQLSRLYVVESSPGLAGASADHRLPLNAAAVPSLAYALAAEVGLPVAVDRRAQSESEPASAWRAHRDWIDACAGDLRRKRGRAVVIAGANQPPAVHALAHWLNDFLGAVGRTVSYRPPALYDDAEAVASTGALVADLQRGAVDSLIVIDCNPVYDAPADWAFAEAMARAPFSLHLGLYRDETARAARWHLPQRHDLESWGDARAFDGTVALQQPLLRERFPVFSPRALLAALRGEGEVDERGALRAYWRQRWGGEAIDARWEQALVEGVVAGSAAPARTPVLQSDRIPRRPPAGDNAVSQTAGAAAKPGHGPPLVLQFRADPCVGDGRFANHPWLQELPRPLSKLSWDNAALIAPATAAAHGLRDGEVVRVEHGGRELAVPVWRVPGHAPGALTLPLGFGRDLASPAGEPPARGVGVNVYPLRHSDQLHDASGARLYKTGDYRALVATQHHSRMEGREIVRHHRADRLPGTGRRREPERISLYPEPTPEPFADSGQAAWGMSINLNQCIGCNACTVACQAENAIPVVGREGVREGREMHWLRIDRYYRGSADNPATYFQPVPCQHCENAPCEYVCPVGATLHDSEGLNVMVYNRCIGTRDCSQNCPYKVRRFNYLEYNRDAELTRGWEPQRNPDVTVRSRGVMEKCTYCLQRISRARRQAKIENRPLRDGEVVTACQQVCPTGAIVFGDIDRADSAVARAKASPLEYSLLAELNTRPRTTYTAVVHNPHPALAAPGDNQDSGNQDSGNQNRRNGQKHEPKQGERAS